MSERPRIPYQRSFCPATSSRVSREAMARLGSCKRWAKSSAYCAGNHLLSSITPTVYQNGTGHTPLKYRFFWYRPRDP